MSRLGTRTRSSATATRADQDPTEMLILGSIDYVVWPILGFDYDNLRFKPEQGVALAQIDSLEPAVVARGSRCGAGWSLFTDLWAIGRIR